MDDEKTFDTNIAENISRIKSTFGDSIDLSIRQSDMKLKRTHVKLAVLFISSMVDNRKLDNLSLELHEFILSEACNHITVESCFTKLEASLLSESKAYEGSDYETLYNQMLSGNTIVLVDGYHKFLILNTDGPEGRSIAEPTSQTIIRGPKEAFTEKLSINISQIRRRIKDKSLKIETLPIGNITKTNVAIIYLDKIAKVTIVNEIRSRLKQIDMDSILEGGYIEEVIKDDPYSIFPTFLNSEKSDSVAANLLEGKVAILVDGTPYVLTAPAVFTDFLQVSEDYYHHYLISSITRIFRYISLVLTLLVPSVYIALSTFHQEMIPTPLLVSIAAQREGVPFPAFVEAILMEVIFEILREAGIRMPRAVGSAISIVGALVLGQAAVQAGIISAVIVIIVSITAIASFAIPNYEMSNAIRYLRFLFMILSATFGLYGIYIGLIILVLHLSKLKSIGVPYLTPLAPKLANGNKDTFIRSPLWKMRRRPVEASRQKSLRTKMKQPVPSGVKNDQELN